MLCGDGGDTAAAPSTHRGGTRWSMYRLMVQDDRATQNQDTLMLPTGLSNTVMEDTVAIF